MYLSDPEWRRIDHELLVHGFVRKHSRNAPSEMVHLCHQFTQPAIFASETDDPINFISVKDEEQSNRCKVEGNRYFKAKHYRRAIVKYTSALNHNPNNHLLYSNRGYCYYLVQHYADALDDIKVCVRIQPAFVKGWYRYGLILEKLHRFGEAGIAYKTAFNLSESTTKGFNQCKSRYLKFMKFLKKRKNKKWLRFMDNFGKNTEALFIRGLMHTLEMRGMDTRTMDIEELAEEHPEARELVKRQELARLLCCVEQSRVHRVLPKNAFEYHSERFNHWSICWSSTAQIYHNKRMFNFSICSGGLAICMEHIYGIPRAQQIIDILYRKMTYMRTEPVPPIKCKKTRKITVSFRMEKEFPEICSAMGTLGIHCYLESEEVTRYNCEINGTRLDGMNHLIEYESA